MGLKPVKFPLNQSIDTTDGGFKQKTQRFDLDPGWFAVCKHASNVSFARKSLGVATGCG